MLSYKDTKVSKWDCLNFTWQNIAANYIGFFIFVLIVKLIPLIGVNGESMVFKVVCIGIDFLLAPSLLIFFVRRKAIAHYMPEKPAKSFFSYVIPGEIFRFLLCIVPIFGYIIPLSAFGVAMASPANALYEIYLMTSERYNEAIVLQQYIPMDFIAYAIVHIVYLAINLSLIFLIYRHFWNKSKRA